MWLIVKFVEELIDKSKGKKRKANISKDMTFETSLNGIKVTNRQEAIKNLREDNTLSIDTFLIDEILGFEVFTSEDKSIGTIPSNIARELEYAMEEGLIPFIKNHKITEGEDGIYNCNLSLGLKMD